MKRAAQLLNGYLPGKLAANPWVLLSLTPLIIFFGVEAYFPKSNFDLEFVITIIVMAHLVTSITALLANLLILRAIRSGALLLLTYLLAGVMDSLVIILGLQIPWIPPGSGLSAWSIITVGSLVTGAWLLMGHLALGLLIGNVQAYNRLQATNSELIALAGSAQAELQSYRNSLQGAIAERIERVLNQISGQLANLSGSTNPELLLSAAADVRALTENDVRQLSHELSESAAESYTAPVSKSRFTWAGFVKFGGDESANIPWVLSVGTLQAVSLALAIGDADTTFVVLVSLLVGFPILVVIDRFRVSLLKNSPMWLQILSAPVEYLITAVIGVQIVRLFAQDFGNVRQYMDTFLIAVPIGAISIWFSIFLIRGFSATFKIRTTQLAELTEELSNSLDQLKTELSSIRTRLAKILHGSVQGRLASVSLALTATASASSAVEADELITQAKTQLELVKADLLESFHATNSPLDFESQLEALLEGWRGLVEIRLALDDEVRSILAANSNLSLRVAEAMQECLTNAVRHGLARAVGFNFELSSAALVLVSVNQWAVEVDDVKPGLGWRQMQANADSFEMLNAEGNFEVRLTWLL